MSGQASRLKLLAASQASHGVVQGGFYPGEFLIHAVHKNVFVLFVFKHSYYLVTLNFLINEHACLAFLEFFATILSIFYVINEKFHPTRLLIYIVNKQTGWYFLFILVCSFIRDFRV